MVVVPPTELVGEVVIVMEVLFPGAGLVVVTGAPTHWQYWFKRTSTSAEAQSDRGISPAMTSTLAQMQSVSPRPETQTSAATEARMSPLHDGNRLLQEVGFAEEGLVVVGAAVVTEALTEVGEVVAVV